MNLEKVTCFFKGAQRLVSKHSPEILTGLGIAGMVTATILGIKATPKAMRSIEKAEDHGIGITSKDGDPDWKLRRLKTKEVIKVTWKYYAPTVATSAFSIACLIGAQTVSARRTAAFAAAYKISETTLAEYKEAINDVVGEEKAAEIKQKVAEKKVDKVDTPEFDGKTMTVYFSEDTDTWFLDSCSNSVFRSSKNKIDAAANKLNRSMRDEIYVSLSDFYDELGLPHTALSDSSGWHIDKGYIDPDLSGAIVKDGKVYVVMDFLVGPEPDFDKYY